MASILVPSMAAPLVRIILSPGRAPDVVMTFSANPNVVPTIMGFSIDKASVWPPMIEICNFSASLEISEAIFCN